MNYLIKIYPIKMSQLLKFTKQFNANYAVLINFYATCKDYLKVTSTTKLFFVIKQCLMCN